MAKVDSSTLPQRVIDHFWAKVNKADGCWLWTASFCDDRGYGQHGWRENGRHVNMRAHRFSWMLCHGTIPDGLNVLHSCDNPSCVNPAHLFLGTNDDNIQDKVEKGRQSRGESHGRAKLTREQVLEIRSRGAMGETHKSIAADFNVNRCQVSCILRGAGWRFGDE